VLGAKIVGTKLALKIGEYVINDFRGAILKCHFALHLATYLRGGHFTS
jgi:hypothetical protein